MTKLIFGCGYLGQRAARLWQEEGHTVYAVTRSAQRSASLAAAGLRPLVADITDPATLRDLPDAEMVLIAVGYDRSAGIPQQTVYVDGLRNILAALSAQTHRLIYISSTGVYGQCDGNWVDEQSPCVPVRRGGQACLDAERLLCEHPLGARSIILRMAGLYGPGRIPRRNALQAGEPLAAASHGYLNLIHVDDAARAILVAGREAATPSLYCIADSQPVLRGDYYARLAELIGAPPPQFVAPLADSPAAERAGSSKRVSGQAFFETFRFEPRYPSFREGLAAIVEAEAAVASAERLAPGTAGSVGG